MGFSAARMLLAVGRVAGRFSPRVLLMTQTRNP
jgi:hypothetical protein